MRIAGEVALPKIFFEEQENESSFDSNASVGGDTFAERMSTDYGDVAMTRGQARALINRFTQEALRKNVTPQTFGLGLTELEAYASSPDKTRSAIRNTLASPMGRMFIENPELAEEAARSSLGGLSAIGINPQSASKYLNVGTSILKQAKEDNLLRSNITNAEIAEKLQRPLYGALQDYLRENKSNPQINALLRRGYPDLQSPGRTPLEAFLSNLKR